MKFSQVKSQETNKEEVSDQAYSDENGTAKLLHAVAMDNSIKESDNNFVNSKNEHCLLMTTPDNKGIIDEDRMSTDSKKSVILDKSLEFDALPHIDHELGQGEHSRNLSDFEEIRDENLAMDPEEGHSKSITNILPQQNHSTQNERLSQSNENQENQNINAQKKQSELIYSLQNVCDSDHINNPQNNETVSFPHLNSLKPVENDKPIMKLFLESSNIDWNPVSKEIDLNKNKFENKKVAESKQNIENTLPGIGDGKEARMLIEDDSMTKNEACINASNVEHDNSIKEQLEPQQNINIKSQDSKNSEIPDDSLKSNEIVTQDNSKTSDLNHIKNILENTDPFEESVSNSQFLRLEDEIIGANKGKFHQIRNSRDMNFEAINQNTSSLGNQIEWQKSVLKRIINDIDELK